ncbi:MAG: YkgJ family cysteine cluster protein [Polyangia bacterium]
MPAIEGIWIGVAAELGFRVSRTQDAYASSDGRGVIAIGVDEVLDPDDAVAQLIFHELCHAITEGDQALALPDWGLENQADHVVREHACLRFAADLSARFGLRGAMAPTTEYRAYYDALPDDPLAPSAGDDAVAIAGAARARFVASRWRVPVEGALAATAALTQPSDTDAHPTGLPWGPRAETCDGCAWMYRGGRGPAVSRCRQTAPAVGDGARVEPGTRACARWEPPVDCQACGACCREAYHSVTVSVRDPVVWREPALIVRNGHRFEILREGPRCAALKVARDHDGTTRYSCTIYENRPQPCRDFAANGRHCLDARRRVGLSARAG